MAASDYLYRPAHEPGRQHSIPRLGRDGWRTASGRGLTRPPAAPRVTRDDQVFDLDENQSAYIPLGGVHRLENPGEVPLHLVEVQWGRYLGEDDIVRPKDN